MDVHVSVDIVAPPAIVWAVMVDVERWHEWTPSVRSIRLLGGKPLAIGSRALIRQPRLPPAVWTVTALEPGKHFTWRSGAPGVWVYAHHSIEALPEGSRATLTLRYEGAIARLMYRLTRDI